MDTQNTSYDMDDADSDIGQLAAIACANAALRTQETQKKRLLAGESIVRVIGNSIVQIDPDGQETTIKELPACLPINGMISTKLNINKVLLNLGEQK